MCHDISVLHGQQAEGPDLVDHGLCGWASASHSRLRPASFTNIITCLHVMSGEELEVQRHSDCRRVQKASHQWPFDLSLSSSASSFPCTHLCFSPCVTRGEPQGVGRWRIKTTGQMWHVLLTSGFSGMLLCLIQPAHSASPSAAATGHLLRARHCTRPWESRHDVNRPNPCPRSFYPPLSIGRCLQGCPPGTVELG